MILKQTPNELLIKEEVLFFLEKIREVILYKNISQLDYFIESDAVFVDDKWGYSGKQEFLSWFSKTRRIRRLEYLQSRTQIISNTIVKVFFTRRIITFSYKEIFSERCYEIIKKEGIWKISKSLPGISCSIEYCVVPKSECDVSVSFFLEKVINSIAFKDLVKMDYLIDKDAIFINGLRRVSRKNSFLKYLAKMKSVKSLEFNDVVIDSYNEKSVTIFFTNHVVFSNLKEIVSKRYYELISQEGIWRISKSLPDIVHNVQYQKLQVQEEEVSIAKTIQCIITAVAFKNVSMLLFFIDEEAILVDELGVERTRDGFIERVIKSPFLQCLEFKNIVTNIDTNKARVTFLRHNIFSNSKETFSERYYELVKRGNVWKILRSAPVTKSNILI
jgi:hypothetical protein